jgi:hypothetical protein
VVNAVGRAPWLARPLKLAGGIDGHRELPRFARERFTRWHARRGTRRAGPPVNLWPDTFTNSFHVPGHARCVTRDRRWPQSAARHLYSIPGRDRPRGRSADRAGV